MTDEDKFILYLGFPTFIIVVVVLLWGFLYPWKTEKQYISNLTWKRVIAEKYNTTECRWESVNHVDSKGRPTSTLERRCHTEVHTVNTFTKNGNWQDEVKWPEYHKERKDSYLKYYEYYYVTFKSDGSKNVLTLYDIKKWEYYKIENKYLVTTSPFGRITKIEFINK